MKQTCRLSQLHGRCDVAIKLCREPIAADVWNRPNDTPSRTTLEVVLTDFSTYTQKEDHTNVHRRRSSRSRRRGARRPLSRWLWLVKWFLAIPHFIILGFLWLAFGVLTVVAFFAILITGRYPRGFFDFNVGVLRWTWRVASTRRGARHRPLSAVHAARGAGLPGDARRWRNNTN